MSPTLTPQGIKCSNVLTLFALFNIVYVLINYDLVLFKLKTNIYLISDDREGFHLKIFMKSIFILYHVIAVHTAENGPSGFKSKHLNFLFLIY